MAFFCRICGNKFTRNIYLESDLDDDVLATSCGHLFHRKCLEVSITNQKLSHATSGTGPFKRCCPSFKCGKEIKGDGITEISTTKSKSPTGDDFDEGVDNAEIRLTKKVQLLTAEKEKLQSILNRVEFENEGYRETIDEIKAECDEISAFMVDDKMMKKGDRVFWVTKERCLAPGRILEIRKKSGTSPSIANCPYTIIKLDKKIQIPSMGGAERETAVVPVTQVLTFKSFFKESFTEFRHKLWKVLDESKERMIFDGNQKMVRSNYRDSSTRLSRDFKRFGGSISNSHEAIDAISVDQFSPSSDQKPLKRNARILRAKSMYFGMSEECGSAFEKHRSTSWTNTAPSPTSQEIAFCNSNSDSILSSPTFSLGPTQSSEIATESECVAMGERVIYYDQNSQYPLVGEVSCILKYTPCAIVKFDDLPDTTEVFKYRTVPLAALFPYSLASLEEKYKIAESYGRIDLFLEEHKGMLLNDNEESEEDDDDGECDRFEDSLQDNEDYFSTSSTEEIFATVHQV